MTEKQQEIRAYCEELERAICAPGASSHAGANYARWGINARADLPRLLDAAVKLRRLATLFGCLAQLIPNADAYLARIEQDLAETAWLVGEGDNGNA